MQKMWQANDGTLWESETACAEHESEHEVQDKVQAWLEARSEAEGKDKRWVTTTRNRIMEWERARDEVLGTTV